MSVAVGAGDAGWDCHVHVFDAAAPTLAGHYRPDPAPLAAIEALGAAHGIGHLVLVQPSVYGHDNAVLLQALRSSGGRHRGVAVLDPAASETGLADMHAAGVRGIRFNLVSPVGNEANGLDRLAPVIRAFGWHVQWYAPASQLPWLAQLQQRCALTFVLDHLGGLGAAASHEHWDALHQLADAGAWLKLSGWYRLSAGEPYRELVPAIARAATLFGDRLVWGSDWPHTSLARTEASRHASLLAPVRTALGDAALARVLRDNPTRLYGPD